MKDIANKGKVPIKVQFEYLNDKDILDLSKEYKVNISLEENTNFETNKEKILKDCNFKTQQERNSYHMFDKSKRKFLTKNSDFIPYIKTKSSIILIDCYKYAKEIIEKVKEESEHVNINSDNANLMNEVKKKEMSLVFGNLENNLQIDRFADEFIDKNGIEYLINIIQKNSGDIRKYSLEGLRRLFSFESTFDFFEKNDNILTILFESFVNNDEISCAFPFFDIIIKLIGGNEERTMNLIEKTNNNFFNKIINYLSEDNKEDNIKEYTLLFINMILNFSNPNKHYELINELTEEGIFDKLEIILKSKESLFSEQLELFQNTLEKILNQSDNNKDNYKNIFDKFTSFVENKKIYHIQSLIKLTQDEDKDKKEEALEELNNLLKEENSMNLIYESFTKIENIEIINSFYDYYITVIDSNEKKFLDFITSMQKYAEKANIKIFNPILKYLSQEVKEEIRNHTLFFINKILSCPNNNKQLEILSFLTNEEIFEIISKLSKNKDNNLFLEQLKQFQTIVEEILEKANKEDDNYKEIKKTYDIYLEMKLYNEIKELITRLYNNKNANNNLEKQLLKEFSSLVNKKEDYKILYNVFSDNNDNNIALTFFDTFVKVFGGNIEKIDLFIESSEEYSKTNNCLNFSKIISYISNENKNDDIKSQAMQFINMMLNFSKKQYELLVKLTEVGIFDFLNEFIKNKNKLITAQLKLFFSIVNPILKAADKNDKDYKNVEEKFNLLNENKKFFDKTLDDFVIIDD